MAARAADADVVVLAAGRSSRLGEPKGLFAVEGKPWLLHQLDAIARTGLAGRVVVVLGFDAERYLAAIPDLAARASIVTNPDPDRGPFSSLQCGLAAVAASASPVFVLPVDVPAPSPDVWHALAAALAPATPAAKPIHDGRGGHPVLFTADFARGLLACPPASRLDHELSRAHVARVPVDDPRVGLNLNEPRDWGKLVPGT